MKRQKFTPGAIVKIPIDGDYRTYGKLLINPYVEIYDFKTKEDISDLEEITSKPVLFTLCVSNYAVTKGRWEITGKADFDEETAQIPLQYIQDAGEPDSCQLVDAFGNMRPASIAECKNLERHAVWEPEHVEDRLRDYYSGKPNKWAESLKLNE